MARLWLQLSCVITAHAFVLPTTKKAAARRNIQAAAVTDLLPDAVVNSLSEEQLVALYNAPDAVAGVLGGASEALATKVVPALKAEGRAVSILLGDLSEAFTTKVVPALKNGGDALKPVVEQALAAGAASASDAFATILAASRAAGWTDTELVGASVVALFLTAATIKKQTAPQAPPPPPPPTPAEKAAQAAQKGLSGAFKAFEVVQGRPYTPLKSRAVEDAVQPLVASAGTIYKTIDATVTAAPTYTANAKKTLEKAYKDAPAVSQKLTGDAQAAVAKKAAETQQAAREAAARAAARGGPYAERLKERAAEAAAKRAAALTASSRDMVMAGSAGRARLKQELSGALERGAPAVQTIQTAYSAAAPAVTKAYSAAAPVLRTAAQRAAPVAAAAKAAALSSAGALRSTDAYRTLAAKPSAAAPLGAFFAAATLVLALPRPAPPPPPEPEPVFVEVPDLSSFELPELDFSAFGATGDRVAAAFADLDFDLSAFAVPSLEGILYVPIFVANFLGMFVLSLPPSDQAALFVVLLAAAVVNGRK